MTGSNADPPAPEAPDAAGSHGGDVIRLGRHVVPASDRRQPLVMEFKARVVTGPGAEPLAREQAAAIRQVLAAIARKHALEGEHRDGTPGS